MAIIVSPTVPLFFVGMYMIHMEGKDPNLYGLLLSIIGFAMFFKAKMSIVKFKKLFSIGCDLMDNKNSLMYFSGWVLMIAGYFLCWT